MKTFTFVGSEMSSKNSAVKQLVQLWCCFVFSSSGASDSCRSNGMFPHTSECGKFFSCTPWGPVLMHCPAGLHFNPQLHICDWPNRAGCMDKQHSTQKCPIYRHPTDCAKFYICAPPGHLLLHCPFGLLFNPVISVCDWPANVQCSTNEVPASEETTALLQTEPSNEATNAVTEEWKEETTHEPLLSATEASAENPNLTTEVQEFSAAVTEESKEETTALPQTDASNEGTNAVTEEWKEETTHEPLLSATEASAENPNLTTAVQEFSAAVTEESKEETTHEPLLSATEASAENPNLTTEVQEFSAATDASNEGTNAVTEGWKEETTHEPLLSATEASAENPNLTTEVQEFSTAVAEESKEETTASVQPEVFSEVVWATTNAANETTAVTEEWKEETTQQLLNATEFSTTTDEETEEPNVDSTRSSEAHTGTSTWNHPSTEAEASLVTTERAPSSASGEAAMFTIEPASTAVDAEAATTEIVSPTTTA
uniref:Chitin-binding type-2 domain-containing protein n=2 Tax=Dendroctonus ponderosae TaxID=77166 RepID=A0AAR5P6D9_DENPD